MNTQPTCKQRWAAEKNSRIRDIRRLLQAEYDPDTRQAKRTREELGTLNEYGLCFDYVAPGTFPKQARGYWRYQLSWGGPSDELRFYADHPEQPNPERIEYRFMDWFDGYGRKLRGKDEELLRTIWQDFQDAGITESEYERACDEQDW